MKRWNFLNNSTKAKSIDDIILLILKNRGIINKEEINKFLCPNLSDVCVDKSSINVESVKKAIKRIRQAIERNEKIVIFGDYDVDGICATAILWETIYSFYKNVFPYIPDRVDEGYGLSQKGIENLESKVQNVKLIITVDNGIVANTAVEFAKSKGMDVIITDHHEIPENLPDAYSIVHTTEMCGAGIAYLLSQKIKDQSASWRTNIKDNEQDNHLELVALATVSDLMPLLGTNRALVKYGLDKLKKTKRVGLLALFRESRISQESLGVYEVGYIIGPRLNAMGRLLNAMDSLRLICTKDRDKAFKYASNVGRTNRQRQLLTEKTTEHAKFQITSSIEKELSAVNQFPVPNIIFISHETYQQGIIGLVASKLVEEFYRPSFVLSIGENYSKGSVRSIRGVNIMELLRSASKHLVNVGGHAMAAGFTIETDKIEMFKKELEKLADKKITAKLLKKSISIDLPLYFNQINYALFEKIQQLSPFGIGNPEPVFANTKVIIEDIRLVGVDGKHLKMVLSQEGINFDAIAFGKGEEGKGLHIGDSVDIVYSIDEDKWNGNKKLQLKIKDIKRTDQHT